MWSICECLLLLDGFFGLPATVVRVLIVSDSVVKILLCNGIPSCRVVSQREFSLL